MYYGNKKYTIDFIQKEFEKEGYILLSTIYIDANHKVECICPKGHRFFTCWHKWQRGVRCKKCYLENNKGENAPNWNPNLTNKDRLYKRHIFGYDIWAKQVKIRDNFTCGICGGSSGCSLVSHHLEGYSANPDLRTMLSNGVCLCENCHKNFHHNYGYGNNTRKQFEEFKNNNQVIISNV